MRHRLVAIDKESGTVRWTREMPRVLGQSLDSSITYGFGSTMAGGVVVAMDVALFGFDPQNGNLRWTFLPKFRIQELSLPSSDDQTVYAATAGGYVYALDPASGNVRWQTVVVDSPAVAYNPVPAGGDVYGGFTVFAGTASDSGGVFALDAATGATRWIFYFPRPSQAVRPRGWIRPAVAGGYIVAATEGGGLYALDRSTGTVAWSGLPSDLASQGNAAVAAFDNRVFVGFNTGVVLALNLGSGKELWRMAEIPYSVRRMTADSQKLYVTFAGVFGALNVSNGTIAWRQSDFGILGAVVDTNRVFGAGPNGFYSFVK
jgi:outer membrane protein assembly factor BamB